MQEQLYRKQDVPGKGVCFVPFFDDNLEQLRGGSILTGQWDGGTCDYTVVSDNESVWVLQCQLMPYPTEGNIARHGYHSGPPIVAKSKQEFIDALRLRTDRKFKFKK